MNLKDLKKKATVSELAIIEMVEEQVRSEYDLEKIKKDVHDELKEKIYDKVSMVLKRHNILDNPRRNLSWFDGYYVRDLCHELGAAVRLELKPEDYETRSI